MNTDPATEKQINYINDMVSGAIETLERLLSQRAADPSTSEKGRTTEARFNAELAFWALMDVESAGLTVSEASDLIDLIKKGLAIVTMRGYVESSFVARMMSDNVPESYKTLVEKILSSMNQGVEVAAETDVIETPDAPVETNINTFGIWLEKFNLKFEIDSEGYEYVVVGNGSSIVWIDPHNEDQSAQNSLMRFANRIREEQAQYGKNPDPLWPGWMNEELAFRFYLGDEVFESFMQCEVVNVG